MLYTTRNGAVVEAVKMHSADWNGTSADGPIFDVQPAPEWIIQALDDGKIKQLNRPDRDYVVLAVRSASDEWTPVMPGDYIALVRGRPEAVAGDVFEYLTSKETLADTGANDFTIMGRVIDKLCQALENLQADGLMPEDMLYDRSNLLVVLNTFVQSRMAQPNLHTMSATVECLEHALRLFTTEVTRREIAATGKEHQWHSANDLIKIFRANYSLGISEAALVFKIGRDLYLNHQAMAIADA